MKKDNLTNFKSRLLLLIVVSFFIAIACDKNDGPVDYQSPEINYVIKSDWSDTITAGEFKDWITLLGSNFYNLSSVLVNDIEIPLKDIYVKDGEEITLQIPDSIPGVINNLITVTTESGTATISFDVNVPPPIVVPTRTSSWLFDDPSNLLKADIGLDLKTGWRENASPRVTHIPSPAGLTGFTSIDGPGIPVGNKAVRVDKWYFFLANHGIDPNGGGSKVNEYTIMIDFRIPQTGVWYTFVQTDPKNSDSDAEYFINNSSGAIGVSATGYSNKAVVTNEWQRFVVSVKTGNDGWLKYFLNGEEVLTKNGWLSADAARFTLEPEFVLFGDNDGDDALIDVAEVATWGVALDADQVAKLEEEMNAR